MRTLRTFLCLCLALLAAGAAQAADPSPDFRRRADDLVALINGGSAPEQLFSPAFLAQVPAAQVRTIAADLTRNYGGARAVASIEAKSAMSGTVILDFERATLRLQMSVAEAPPHLIESLLVTGADTKGDRVGDVLGAIAALPGDVSLAAMRLSDGEPKSLLSQQADRPLAIGSAFKLFILAELVREVKAGERHWTDVVPLNRRSLPSGFLQTWPQGAPLTLHSLAALMISQSDNSAADTLLALLGREKVERSLAEFGVKAPERLRPFLSTREAFLLKAGDPSLRTRWIAAGEAARRALLAGDVGRASLDTVDPQRFAAGPLSIGEIEWFASPADLVRTLDWLRRNGDERALGILAINPGIPSLKRDFADVGFKGGSEAGVLNLSFLLRRQDGAWMAVAVTWNNPAAAVDEGQLVALMSRLLALLAKDPG
jgi:beta-lactamase class A